MSNMKILVLPVGDARAVYAKAAMADTMGREVARWMNKEAASPYSTVAKFIEKGLSRQSMVAGLKKIHGLDAKGAAKIIKNVKNKPKGVQTASAIKKRKIIADASRVSSTPKTKYIPGINSGYVADRPSLTKKVFDKTKNFYSKHKKPILYTGGGMLVGGSIGASRVSHKNGIRS